MKEEIQFSWEPFPHSFLTFTIIEVRDDEGFYGYSAVEFSSAYKIYIEGLVRTVLQQTEFYSPKDIHRIINIGSWIYMRLGPVEAAIWDLIARKEGKPLYKILGGNRRKIKVYASTGRLMELDEATKLIDWYLDLGIDIVKIRFHRKNPREDIEILRILKKIYGDTIKFAVDANQAWGINPPYWDRKLALKISEELYQLDVLWLEEPLYKEDVDGYVWLRERTDIPIAGGELEFGLSIIKRSVDLGMYDILQYDAIYGNGVYEAVTAANYAYIKNLGFLSHAWDPGLGWLINLHVTASLPESLAPYIETPLDPIWWWDSIFVMCDEKPEISNGYVEIPDEPGIGYKPNLEKIKKYIL